MMTICGIDIDKDYYDWLCDLVGIRDRGNGYSLMARDLHRTSFYSLIEHDENRAMDGLDLRDEYFEDINYPKYVEIEKKCSVLEMMIGLARRMSFQTGRVEDDCDRTSEWFWELIANLGLDMYDDEHYVELNGGYRVDEIVDILLKREYRDDGLGGLFPLENPSEDQRFVEIWYQMNAYLMEKDEI